MSLKPGDIFNDGFDLCLCVAVYRKGWSSRMLLPGTVDTCLVLHSRGMRLVEVDWARLTDDLSVKLTKRQLG